MMLSFNEVKLMPLQEQDIEMLRQWRNDKKIAKHMFYQEHITKEMQQTWFQNIKKTDYYFIIHYKNEAIGLIDLKKENKSYFAGLFIYNHSYWGTPIPVLASLALLHCFLKL
ncbi:MAG: GNAT family N-acetyltransferase [Chitinophagales bacterium]|nr:GNAT family N-acetyltransferase [Chitinophagales bacterium]